MAGSATCTDLAQNGHNHVINIEEKESPTKRSISRTSSWSSSVSSNRLLYLPNITEEKPINPPYPLSSIPYNGVSRIQRNPANLPSTENYLKNILDSVTSSENQKDDQQKEEHLNPLQIWKENINKELSLLPADDEENLGKVDSSESITSIASRKSNIRALSLTISLKKYLQQKGQIRNQKNLDSCFLHSNAIAWALEQEKELSAWPFMKAEEAVVELLNLLLDTGYVTETSNSQTRFTTGNPRRLYFRFSESRIKIDCDEIQSEGKLFLKEDNAVTKTELQQGSVVQYLNGGNDNNIPPSSAFFKSDHHETIEEEDSNPHYFNFWEKQEYDNALQLVDMKSKTIAEQIKIDDSNTVEIWHDEDTGVTNKQGTFIPWQATGRSSDSLNLVKDTFFSTCHHMYVCLCGSYNESPLKRRRRKCCVAIFSVLVVSFLLMIFGPPRNIPERNQKAVTILSIEDVKTYIIPLIEDITSVSVLKDFTTPQHKSMKWISNDITTSVSSSEVARNDPARIVQRYILGAIFYATGANTSWSNYTGWMTSMHECEWYGIKCDFRGTHQKSNHMTDLIDDSKDDPLQLAVSIIDLSENMLDGFLPEELAFLSHLQELHLQSNNLKDMIFRHFSKLQNLRILNLHKNQFTGEIPEDIGTMSQLSTLILSDNKLSGTLPDSISNLSNLSNLHLSNNLFSGDFPIGFISLSNIQSLLMDNLSIEGFISEENFSELFSLPKLTFLQMHANQLKGTLPETIESPTLEIIHIDRNSLSGPLPKLFSSPNLRELHLGFNNLSGTLPGSLFSLARIEHIHLENNKLGGQFPLVQNKSEYLSQIRLENNFINGNVPASMCDSITKVFKVDNSKVSCSCCNR